MHNVKVAIEGAEIVIRIRNDAGARAASPMSKTGKSKLLASSGGFMAVEGQPGLALSINASLKE